MANYKLSKLAKEDLIRIHHFGVEKFGMIQADKYFETIFNYFEIIAQRLYSVLKEGSPIVGYDLVGGPIEKQQLIDDLEEAERQIERGECITLDELDEESKNW